MCSITRLLSMDTRTMHQLLDEGRVSHKLVMIGNKLECCFESTNEFLKRLMGILDNFKKVVYPLKLIYLKFIACATQVDKFSKDIMLEGGNYRNHAIDPSSKLIGNTLHKRASSCQ